MNALAFGLGALMVVCLPLALYVMLEDVVDFVEQDVLPLFRD